MILWNVSLSDIPDLMEHTSMTSYVPTIETEPNKQINPVGWRRRNMGSGTCRGRVSLFITLYISSWPYQLASQWMGAVELWNELARAILCLSARFIWSKISYCDNQNRVPRDVWLSSLVTPRNTLWEVLQNWLHGNQSRFPTIKWKRLVSTRPTDLIFKT